MDEFPRLSGVGGGRLDEREVDLRRAAEDRAARHRRLAEREVGLEDRVVEGMGEVESGLVPSLADEEAALGGSRHRLGLGLAHQLFLYGLPEGPRKHVPIRSLSALSKRSGVPRDLLEVHAVGWHRESMRLAREASPMHRFAMSREARESHDRDVEALRAEVDRLAVEVSGLEVGTKEHDSVSRLLLAVRKDWREASGVASGLRISEAAAKMEAKALLDSLKAEEGRMEGEGGGDGSDVFDI